MTKSQNIVGATCTKNMRDRPEGREGNSPPNINLGIL